jgi:hypothetical protein
MQAFLQIAGQLIKPYSLVLRPQNMQAQDAELRGC